ncbi:putative quinol monooxygenase [Bdellovibrio sp. HCB288]|uniref:putative quinol monooxygenase n=1 Tax=Bdellovibrio sp. HCB288 TaxID=3394355 RepID=UPI0039B69D27
MSVARINKFIAKNNSTDELRAFLSEVCTHIRKCPGNLSAELVQSQENTSEFLVIERWTTKEAHQNSAKEIPAEQLQKVSGLLADKPTGTYFNDFSLELSEQDYF